MNDHEKKATAEVRDIANRIDALKITDKKRRQPRKSLKESLHSYGEAADALSEHAANVVKLLRAGGLFNEEDAESICTVQTRAIELGRVARLLNDSATQAVVRQVASLGDKTFFNVDGLLQHFEKPVEKIAQGKIQGAQSGDIFDSVNKPPKHMPRYLFRAYDDNSTGRNDKDVIASILSQCGEANRHGIDIFSMDYKEASQMLHQHLDKGPFSSNVTDNLVSWSSSLMFVIQYANWRFCRPQFSHPGDICICAVDTSQFPRGQFARDKWLLNSFKDAELSDQENNFRDLRLNRSEYDNGEYLSQGVLHIEKRSCTLSLRRLKNAGLWDLYPEFNVNDVENDADVRVQWTNVQCALDIARNCFPGFDQDDMALLLLSFCEPIEDIDYKEPAEVDRYSTLRKRLSELREASGERGMKLFDQLYGLEDTEEN
ncbi:hypothetical protein FocTR4_00009693 [Fusarium oxysporum f. sp. cubense]|uniref:DUF7587 domain-containing protein n=1 Tax=Fusarium oxysporum f. sp. cubense TaxID=61366 RepID=A0A5C6T9B4_FUSOC|nr:hypothetical protein FocTR4_00009693 [Fusarium oxysporum f. sp. cubense]